MKRQSLFFLFIFCSSIVLGQSAPLGKDLVREFSNKMLAYQSVSFNLSFTIENLQEGISETYEGKFKLKDKSYYLDLMEMEVYFNGQTKWQFIPTVNEVTISEPIDLDGGFFDDPTQIFRSYEQDFKSKYMGEKVVRGVSFYEVELYPEDLSAPYSILKITFKKQNLEPVSVKYQGKDGVNYIIEIESFKVNQQMSSDEFNFVPANHAGIVVVDLR